MLEDDTTEPFGDGSNLAPDDDELRRLYVEIGIPLDRLVYTPDFDVLYGRFVAGGRHGITRARVFRRLATLRKRGDLPRLVRDEEPPGRQAADP